MAVVAPQSALTQIQNKVRSITGRPDITQLTVAALNQYIQTFYVYDLPEHLRLFNLKETYTFTTQANIDSYAFDRNHYVTLEPPLFIDGYQSFWSQSPQQFYNVWPKIEFQLNAGAGTGLANQTFQVLNAPILRAQPRFNPDPALSSGTFDSDIILCIRQQDPVSGLYTTIQTMIDDGSGNLINSTYLNTPTALPVPLLGSVNYLTGLFTVFAPIPANQEVMISSVPYTPGRSTSVLFFDDRFVLRPVPDACYKVSVEVWRNPLEFLDETNNPELNEWWQLIALGASLKVFEDQGELEEYAKFMPIFEKYKLLAQRRTIVQQTNQRTATIYEQQINPGYFTFWNRF